MRVVRQSKAATAAAATIAVGIAELAVANKGILATHALGSCIAVCLWDRERRIGGLLHFMLPSSDPNRARGDRPAMYGDTGIALLIRRMQSMGADLRQVRARLIGGSSVAGTSVFAVGQRNITSARRTLWSHRITVEAEDVGGEIPRTVRMRVLDGRVLVTSPARADLVL